MIICSYVLCMPDDCDTVADALNSLSSFSDKIILMDGGMTQGTLCHHPRYLSPLSEWIKNRPEYVDSKWNGVEFLLWENEFKDPASQRNHVIRRIQSDVSCDWVVWIDADEVCSLEFARGVRDVLSGASESVVGAYEKWLNLVQDEHHCVGGHHSDWLAHPRIHRPNAAYFSGSWHEHMVIDRGNLARWDVRIIHTRALYRRRLLVQRGHPTIRERSAIDPTKSPFWDDAVMESVPAGVSWTSLVWPDGEIQLPFHMDALEVWNELGDLR